MHNSGLLYTTRLITGDNEKRYANLHNFKIVESACRNVDLLTRNKTSKEKIHLRSLLDLNIRNCVNFYADVYERDYVNFDNWMQVYDALDVSHLERYDVFYVIGSLDLWRSGLNRKSKRVGVFPADRGQLKFRSTGTILVNLLAILKAHRTFGIPVHEFCIDPIEMTMNLYNPVVAPKDNYWTYHGYDIPKYSIHRLDSLSYYLSKQPATILNPEKIYDLTFGYTVLENSERDYLVKDVNELTSNFDKKNLYVKNYKTNEDNLVVRDIYLQKISESKYTFMLPSYDKHCFSIFRFQESLHNNCLPLIHHECNIEDIQKSFDIDLSPFVRITPFASESQRLEALQYLKSKVLNVEKSFRY